ncbi:phage tail protein [Providencia rettgeri]|uniref:phage tail-collar fiber domain-containing protein n=1 Tax=Providencia rettgeri TaxID=587 RepID=UPI001B38FD5C|nr:phage tail protein [Providencia rettgeri]ELY3855407.1 phage tail protein [Providencia rettgeri]MBQ0366022.1 phage tail protein [Providencia rettgeri]
MTPFYTILTNYGKTVLAEALAAQQPLEIPHMAVGDGGGEYYDPTEAQTNLRNEIWRGDLNDLRTDIDVQGQVIAEAIIPMGIDGDWTVREIGLFDAKGGLIAVGKYPETYIPSALSGAKSQVHISIVINVDNVAAVQLIVDHGQVLASKLHVESKIGLVYSSLIDEVGASLVGFNGGIIYPQNTIGDELSKQTNTITYLSSQRATPTYEVVNNDRFIGIGGNSTEVKAPAGKAAFHSIGMEDAILDGLKISGDGKTGTVGTSGIYIEGTKSSKQPLRNEFKNLRIQDLRDFGLRLSAGWGNIVRLSRFTNIGKSGIAIESSPILSGWGGSGHIFEAVYAASCGEYGISNYTGWCNTFINPVLEYNKSAFRERGNNSIWINPWLEGNENPPLIERGVVILGGRGISFRNSLRTDLTEFEPEEAVTHIQNKGIAIFRNQELKVLNVNGSGFKEARSTSGMEIAGARASTSETRVPLVRITGYSTPTSAGAASFDKLVSEIQLNASGSEAQNGSNYGRIVFKTGVNVSVGDSPYPISNRWEVRYDGVFHPSEDNKYSIGRPGLRVSEIYSAVGNINTSDERYKIPVDVSDDIKEREKKAALEIKSNIYRFQFKGAVDEKGNHARTHFGVGAQTVMSIMEKYGLDARDYGFFCHDQWDDIYDSWEDEFKEELTDDIDEKGEQVINKILVKKAGSKLIKPAGDMYGIRYDELIMFILSAI